MDSGVEWRRLHKVTPFLNAWKVAAALIAVALYQSSEFLNELRDLLPAVALLGVILGILLIGFLIGLGYGILAWRRTTYGVSEESVFLHKGVLFRQQRYVRLDRVQAIEVTQPLLARVFGFATVKIESAGGPGSNLTIAFLIENDAQVLRNELLARSAGLKVGSAARAAAPDASQPGQPIQPAATGPAAAAPERELFTLGVGRLVGSLALSVSIMLMVLVIVGILVAAVVIGSFAPIAAMIAPLIGGAAYFWGRFAGEFSYRVATSPDGIRLRHGLLETKARTVPPGRVQAVRVSQPLLWRTKGWWRVQVNIAGYGAEEQVGTVLFPVATEEEVGYLMSLVLPDLGDPRPLEVLTAGMSGIGSDEGFTTSPPIARWVDWITWRRTGFRVTGTAILLRTGRLWRQLAVVPHERAQSLGLTQGPIERKMQLATFVVHSTPGPVTPQVHHIDVRVAKQLIHDQAERARRARDAAGPEQWMRGHQEAGPDGGGPGSLTAEADSPVPTTRMQFAGVLPPSHAWGGQYGGVLPGRIGPVGRSE